MKRSPSPNSYSSENQKQRTSTAEVQDNIMDQEESKTPLSSPTESQIPINVTSSPIKRETIQIGTSNFAELVKNDSFVDKTLLIKDFVTSGKKAILITCPRRFGKSTNMDMIKTFLEIEVDTQGARKPEEERINYELFAKLAISKEVEFTKKHLGQYPVISVSFKDVRGREYGEIFNKVLILISDVFKQHDYMINVLDKSVQDAKTRLQKEKSQHYLNKFLSFYKDYASSATQEEIENSLNFLCELLSCHFGKKVYVLIDEYDTPIDSIMRSTLTDDSTPLTNEFIDSMLGAVLKDNDTYLEKGLMTGISVIAKNSSSSKLNNVIVHRFLDDHKYGQYYGFTNHEVSEQIDNEVLDYVQKYYNGYLIIGQNLQIYNPWSIMNYIKTKKMVNYWCQSGPIEYINSLFKYTKIKEKFNLLLTKDGISFQFNNTPTIEDIQSLKKLLNCSVKEIQESHVNLFFSYIFEHGYLSPVKTTDQSASTVIYNYKIPNQEIKQEFANNAIDYYIDAYQLKRDDVDSTIAILKSITNNLGLSNNDDLDLSNKMNSLASAIQRLFETLELTQIQTTKDGSHANEALLHTIVGWIIIQSNAKKFGSEVSINTGMKSGKADIAATYKDLGIIIELKYNKTAEEALEQIEDKNYNTVFSTIQCIPKILDIGMNLSKEKKVTIKHKLVFNVT